MFIRRSHESTRASRRCANTISHGWAGCSRNRTRVSATTSRSRPRPSTPWSSWRAGSTAATERASWAPVSAAACSPLSNGAKRKGSSQRWAGPFSSAPPRTAPSAMRTQGELLSEGDVSDSLFMPITQRVSARELTGWEAVWMPLGEGEAERLTIGRGTGWKPIEVPRQLAGREGRQAIWYRTEFPRPDHAGRVVLRIGGALGWEAGRRNLGGRQREGGVGLSVPSPGRDPLRLRREVRLGGGTEQTVTMRLALPGARRWHPWRFGEQPLYHAEIVARSEGGESSRIDDVFAFRELGWDIGPRP